VAYLDSLAQFGWKLDLARIIRLCALAGHPEQRFPAALVGGSAGKGSTCAFLAAILRAAGLRSGLAPKPHLVTHRERVQIDGALISEERFAALMSRIVPLATQVTREEGDPTVFEVMTLLAFLHFAEGEAAHSEPVDRAVVEVGLGGRFDATNVLPADLAIISSIGLDHTDRLGDTVEQIAFEKAGILKPGQRVINGAGGAALAVIEEIAAQRGVEAVWRLGQEIHAENIRVSAAGTRLDLRLPGLELPDLSLSLVGEHQARNAALAAAAAWWLRDHHPTIGEAEIRAGLAQAVLPGRLQVLRQQPLLLLDGAHSPDRAEALAAALREAYLPGPEGRRVLLVIGCSSGHEPSGVVHRLAPLASVVYATRSAHPAAIPAAEVAEAARECGLAPSQVHEVEPVTAALEAALAAAMAEDLVLVTGSLFAVGEVLAAAG
jgi:dihydrofolate synthase/folylpolyglutamate synthase